MSLHFIILIKITCVSSEQQRSCKNGTKSSYFDHIQFSKCVEKLKPLSQLFFTFQDPYKAAADV